MVYCFFMAAMGPDGFCSLEEYLNNRDARLREDELCVGSLCSYMMRLNDQKIQAAKQIVRIENIIPKSDIVVVQLAWLNEDLDTSERYTDAIADGFVIDFEGDGSLNDIPIQEAYLCDYFQDEFGELLRQASRLVLSAV
jgi:hypothetical protein